MIYAQDQLNSCIWQLELSAAPGLLGYGREPCLSKRRGRTFPSVLQLLRQLTQEDLSLSEDRLNSLVG
jgi:hypothetical protein